MIVITTTSAELAERARHIMAAEVLHNPDLNGADYRVELGDFDSIDGADELTGAALHIKLFRQDQGDA